MKNYIDFEKTSHLQLPSTINLNAKHNINKMTLFQSMNCCINFVFKLIEMKCAESIVKEPLMANYIKEHSNQMYLCFVEDNCQ